GIAPCPGMTGGRAEQPLSIKITISFIITAISLWSAHTVRSQQVCSVALDSAIPFLNERKRFFSFNILTNTVQKITLIVPRALWLAFTRKENHYFFTVIARRFKPTPLRCSG
ncbi:MAG: hypothetical protein AB7P18_28070, partial [Candidatus Binatia bacterium]